MKPNQIALALLAAVIGIGALVSVIVSDNTGNDVASAPAVSQAAQVAQAGNKFSIGDRVKVSVPSPYTSTYPFATANMAGNPVGSYPQGSMATIAGGPTSNGGHVWYQVSYDSQLTGCTVSSSNTCKTGWDWQDDYTFVSSNTPAPISVTISGVTSSNMTTSGATINWTTNIAADSQVEYGLTTSYGSQSSLNNTKSISHSVTLTGLTANTAYNYRVKSGGISSANSTFTTSANPTASTFTLTVNVGANGTVSSGGGTLNKCSTNCKIIGLTQADNKIILTAYPASGYTATWSNCTSISGNTCNVTLSGNTTVGVTFATAPVVNHTLTITKSGNGTVTSSPAGINCGSTCSVTTKEGTVITLSATPDAGYTFTSWGEGGSSCAGTGTCALALSRDYSILVIFTANPLPTCTAPANLRTTNLNSTEVDIAWDTSNCSTYHIYRNGLTAQYANATGLTFANTGLTPKTAYTYQVSAYNTSDESTKSNTISANTDSATFAVGDQVKATAAGVSVRSTPSASGTSFGTTALNLSGTVRSDANLGVYADGYYWFKVEFSGLSVGWIQENYIAKDVITTYTLGVTTSGSGTGTVAKTCAGTTCPTNINSGTAVSLTATPTGNSTFSGWTGTMTSSANTLAFNITSSMTEVANFTTTPNPTFPITASAGANGSISPSGIVTVSQGSSQTFTITPSNGYQVASVVVDGASVGALTSYAFNNVQGSHTISATFSVVVPPPGGTYWFVRPGGTGNGTSWSSAWNINTINWSNVKSDDVIWLAGGTYTSQLNFGKSGISGHPITVRRVLSSDPSNVTTGVLGWSSTYDSVAVIPGVDFGGGPNYTTLDGRNEYGIKVTFGNGGRGINIASGGTTSTGVTVQYVEVAGPGLTTVEADAIYGVSYTGSSDAAINSLLISHAYIHDTDTLIMRANWNNSIVEYTKFYNSRLNTSVSAPPHPNAVYSYPSYNSIFRYNDFKNNESETVFYSYGYSSGEYWYGNTFDNSTGYAFEVRITSDIGNMSYGSFFLYNNVFKNSGYGSVLMAGPISNSSRGYNNIFINNASAPSWGAGSGDYNYSVTGKAADSGAHSITGADPFVDSANDDFHLKAGAAAINKGLALTADGYINKDRDNNTRGADGSWDMGAYEYGGTVQPGQPTATISASLSSITSGQSVTLTWSSTNATSCTGSGFTAGATSGSVTVSPTVTTTYGISCAGTGGTSPVANATVAIGAPVSTKFTIGQQVSPTATVNVRQTGAGTILGTQTIGAIATVLSGPVSALLDGINVIWWSLNFTSPASPDGYVGEDNIETYIPNTNPTASLSGPTSITTGSSATLTWSSSNVTSCTASGGWTGTKATSGSQTVSPTVTTTYTITCSNDAGQTAVSNATVSVGTVTGGNWYVRPGTSGGGTSWNDATDIGSIMNKNVQPGDTIWLAGGSYGSWLNVTKSGISGRPITFKRVLSTDAVPTAAAGWQSSYDSTVNLGSTIAGGGAKYITIDGRTDYGIQMSTSDNSEAIQFGTGSSLTTDIQLLHIKITGPWNNHNSSVCSNGIWLIGGGNHLISHVYIDGITQQISFNGVNGAIIEYSKLINAGPLGPNLCHPDTLYTDGASNITFRYNYVTNVLSESVFIDYGGSSGMYFYGNVMDIGAYGTGIALEASPLNSKGAWGDFHIFNNTFVNWAVALRGSSSVPAQIYNNIFLNTALTNDSGFGIASGGINLNTSTSPLVSSSDYHLRAATTNGTTLSSPYNMDMDGQVRGSDGVWDLGAYEY